MNISLLNNY